MKTPPVTDGGESVARLVRVNPDDEHHLDTLYELLQERTPEQSISHRQMPAWPQHVRFVQSDPYEAWYLIMVTRIAPPPAPKILDMRGEFVGSVYISRQRELGVCVFKSYQRQGYAEAAVREMLRLYSGRLLANVNPRNKASIRLWEKLGFKHVQNTYARV